MHWIVALLVCALAIAAAGWHAERKRWQAETSRCTTLADELRKTSEEADMARSIRDALLSHAGLGILVLDRSLVIQSANDAAVLLLDLACKDLQGTPLADAAVGSGLVTAVERARSTGSPYQTELRRLGPGAGVVTVTVAPIRDKGWLVLADDLTELRRAETIRRDFVANVSHELRTPMASIRAMAETLRDGALDDPEVAAHFLDTILAESGRLTRIADDLLTLSDAETKPPDLHPVHLAEVCERVLDGLRPQAERAGLSLQQALDSSVVVMADQYRMEQVIMNLVDNAIKYTPAGGSICVVLRQEGSEAVLSVSDTGIGILQEHQERIFERFYRVDKARSRQSGGTGLGLSIVKHIVEAHGGSASVQSEYTRGSTFTVRLPAGEPPDGTPAASKAKQL
jgi:two-component system phosphate regulon sensor histidine kinase PhoR